MTNEELARRIGEQFRSVIERMEQGFNDSKTRDEDLRSLMVFGLEAREILRDEMLRQFETADRKHDQQITLLKDAVNFWRSPR